MAQSFNANPPMRATNLAIAAIGGLITACVSSGTHEQLKQACADEQARLTKEIASRDAHVQGMEEEISTLDEQIQALSSDKEALESELLATRKDLTAYEALTSKLRENLAATIKTRSKLQASIEDMTLALKMLEGRRREVEKRVAEYKALLTRFKPLIDTGSLRVEIVDGRMVVALPTDVLFRTGSAKLSAEGELALQQVTNVLTSVKERKFQVEGHTDNVPIHNPSFASNWELASQRSINVVKMMIASGMPPARISSASFAEYKPAADNATEEGRAANRRIAIVLLPDLSALPGADEIQSLANSS